jgi:hypothetical protein
MWSPAATPNHPTTPPATLKVTEGRYRVNT